MRRCWSACGTGRFRCRGSKADCDARDVAQDWSGRSHRLSTPNRGIPWSAWSSKSSAMQWNASCYGAVELARTVSRPSDMAAVSISIRVSLAGSAVCLASCSRPSGNHRHDAGDIIVAHFAAFSTTSSALDIRQDVKTRRTTTPPPIARYDLKLLGKGTPWPGPIRRET